MAHLAILGAGVMGSALAVPARANGHRVTLFGTPLDEDIVRSVTGSGYHPRLDLTLPAGVEALGAEAFDATLLSGADALIVAVSSAGIGWAGDRLRSCERLGTVGLITKGLVPNESGPPLTYADTVPRLLSEAGIAHGGFVGIGGPCIAREIALGVPTATSYASHDRGAAIRLGQLLDTDVYRIHLSDDVVGLEACAALKNFLAIGVSATISAHLVESAGAVNERSMPAKNPTAALFTQATGELERLVGWIGGQPATAHGLAGAGDLHVTVGGGRNSRLGRLLGEGMRVQAALDGPLAGETVEGRDTGRVLGPALRAAQAEGAMPALPLTDALLEAIERDAPLRFDYRLLGDLRR